MSNYDDIQTTSETKSGLLDNITKQFSGFINLFKKHGIFTTIICLLIFLIFWSLIVNPIHFDNIIERQLEKRYEQEKAIEQTERVEAESRRTEADAIVTPLIENIVEKFNVDRVLLFELHNNSRNISNVDFLFFSCSYEALNLNDYDIDYIGDSFQRQYISNMLGNEVVTLLSHRNYIVYNNISEYRRTKAKMLVKMSRMNINNVMLIPFTSGDHKIKMFMCVASRSEIDAQNIYNYVEQFKPQITDCLM